MSVLAFLLGLLGMVSISRSNGRLTGMPAAIVGIALGVLVTVGHVALAVGAGSAYNFWQVNITQPMSRLVEAAYDGDVTAARAEMTTAAAGEITDGEIIRFGQAMQMEFGDFQGMPDTFRETVNSIFEGFARAQGGQAQRGGSSQAAVPMTLITDAGGIVIFGAVDPAGQPSQSFRYPDLFVLMPNMEALLLRENGPARNEALRLNFTPITPAEYLERAANQPAPSSGADSDAGEADSDADEETPL